MDRIPAKIIIANDVESQQIALVENLQRDNLNAIEEARGYKRLLELGGGTQKDLAAAVSKNQATISNALRLLDLSDEIQDMMFDGLITAGHGRALLTISDEEARIKLAKKVADEHLSVRETESIARLYSSQGFERSKKPPSPRSFKLVARKLRQMLDTNVRVKSARGKNIIEIEFKDEDDLNRVFAAMSDTAQEAKPVEQLEASSSEEPETVTFTASRYVSSTDDDLISEDTSSTEEETSPVASTSGSLQDVRNGSYAQWYQ